MVNKSEKSSTGNGHGASVVEITTREQAFKLICTIIKRVWVHSHGRDMLVGVVEGKRQLRLRFDTGAEGKVCITLGNREARCRIRGLNYLEASLRGCLPLTLLLQEIPSCHADAVPALAADHARPLVQQPAVGG